MPSKVAVTGANSSVGQNLLQRLAREDRLDAVACVRSERAAGEVPVSPRVETRIVSYEDADQLAQAFDGVSSVVHLAGILVVPKGSSYATANTAATEAVAEASRRAGVEHVVFTSALGADPGSRNGYLRSKGEGERAVAAFGGGATIIRTPILLGPGTAGAKGMVRTASRGRARLLGGGAYLMRPLDIDDLGRAILNACERPPEDVRVLELVGPEPIAYRDLIGRIAGMLGKSVEIGAAPVWGAKLAAAVRSRLTGGGITPTVIDVITASEVVEHNADTELGVDLTPLDETLEKMLSQETEAQ